MADPVVSFDRISLAPNTDVLLIFAPEQLADGRTRIVDLQVEVKTLPLFGSPQYVGGELFTPYLLPFELVSILLLVAMMGAIALTHRELQKEARPRRRVVRRPLVGSQAITTAADKE